MSNSGLREENVTPVTTLSITPKRSLSVSFFRRPFGPLGTSWVLYRLLFQLGTSSSPLLKPRQDFTYFIQGLDKNTFSFEHNDFKYIYKRYK